MRPGVTQGRLLRQLEAEAPAERGRGGPQARAQSGSRETLWGSWVPIVLSPVQPGSLQAASTLESSRPDGTLVLPSVSAKRKKERNTRQKKKNLFFKRTPNSACGDGRSFHSSPLHSAPSTQDARSWYNLPLGTQTTLFYPDRKSWVLGTPVDSPRTHFNICTGALDRIRVLKG